MNRIFDMNRNSFLIDEVLTVPGAAVTLKTNSMGSGNAVLGWKRRGARAGQTAVEYMLTTMTLVVAFSAMYGVISNALKKLFTAAAIRILTSYY